MVVDGRRLLEDSLRKRRKDFSGFVWILSLFLPYFGLYTGKEHLGIQAGLAVLEGSANDIVQVTEWVIALQTRVRTQQ